MEGVRANAWIPPDMISEYALDEDGRIRSIPLDEMRRVAIAGREIADLHPVLAGDSVGEHEELVTVNRDGVDVNVRMDFLVTRYGITVEVFPALDWNELNVSAIDGPHYWTRWTPPAHNEATVAYYYDLSGRALGIRVLRRNYSSEEPPKLLFGPMAVEVEVLRYEFDRTRPIPLILSDSSIQVAIEYIYLPELEELKHELGLSRGTIVRVLEDNIARWRKMSLRDQMEELAHLKVRDPYYYNDLPDGSAEILPSSEYFQRLLEGLFRDGVLKKADSVTEPFADPAAVSVTGDVVSDYETRLRAWAEQNCITVEDLRRLVREAIENYNTIATNTEVEAFVSMGFPRESTTVFAGTRQTVFNPPDRWLREEILRLEGGEGEEGLTVDQSSPPEEQVRDALGEGLRDVSDAQAEELVSRIVARWNDLSESLQFEARLQAGFDNKAIPGVWARDQLLKILTEPGVVEGRPAVLGREAREEDRDRAEREVTDRAEAKTTNPFVNASVKIVRTAAKGRK